MDATLPKEEKVIFFIRHGQSLANVARNEPQRGEDPDDPKFRDTLLSPLGEQQAKLLAERVIPSLQPQPSAIVCSPLRRAIQTTYLAFGSIQPSLPVYLSSLVREIYWLDIESRGLPISTLRETLNVLTQLGSQVDATSLAWLESGSDRFWQPDEEHELVGSSTGSRELERRKKLVLSLLLQSLYNDRPEHCIAVVCHWGVIMALLDIDAKNCDVIKVVVGPIEDEGAQSKIVVLDCIKVT